MKEKKYIDRLYQEKFRDFEAAPRDAVWKSIEAKLQEKKKRKPAIPLWYRYTGVAAIFALLLMLGDWILPVQPSAAVANEEIEEAATPPANVPAFAPIIAIPPGNNKAIADNDSRNSKVASSRVIALNSPKKEKRTAQEITSKLGAENAVFETSVPVADIPLQKKQPEPVKTPEELKPSIFDELKAAEETEVVDNQRKVNLEISTHATPIYYGKMGKANPLDVGFNDRREAEVTYSYGVSVAVNISDRVKLRSGVNRVDLSYSSSGMNYQSASGYNPVRNASLLKVKEPDVKMVSEKLGGRTKSSANRTETGYFTQRNLNQKMGYIEVPVEFEVNLLESKFELNLIGGGSTLFLEENEVTLYTGNTAAAGKADNLNQVSFSANLGLGVDYRLSEKFKLNFEPMLKYQLKTFDSPTGDVQPYFFGVYTGFSYKF